jgi:[ribosomal protein S5]-alanine N-acetyltransferase
VIDMVVRRSRAEDAEAILAIRRHPVTRRYQPLDPGTLAEQRQALAERGSQPLDPTADGKRQWVIEVDGQVAGWITLTISEREHHTATVGYSLGPAFHGRGIMPAALARVIPIAFDPNGLALDRLEAVAAVENIASRRVLEKTGFRFEGIARDYLIIAGVRVDHARYGLLRSDMMPRECTNP